MPRPLLRLELRLLTNFYIASNQIVNDLRTEPAIRKEDWPEAGLESRFEHSSNHAQKIVNFNNLGEPDGSPEGTSLPCPTTTTVYCSKPWATWQGVGELFFRAGAVCG
jgi:hypothetical protein